MVTVLGDTVLPDNPILQAAVLAVSSLVHTRGLEGNAITLHFIYYN